MLKINRIRSTRCAGFPSLGADTKISSTAEKTDPKQGEAYWKRRATELHARLIADERPAAAGHERVDRLQRDVAAIECIKCRERTQLESQLARMKQDQTRLDTKVESDRAAIQAFEEEGRRAGALPGWLRVP